jgi:hypothetical protein
MPDLRNEVRPEASDVPPHDVALDGLVGMQDKRRRSGRVLSAVVALSVSGVMVAGAIAVLGHGGSAAAPGAGGATGANQQPTGHGTGSHAARSASGPTLVAGPGEYYFWKYAVVFPSGRAHLTYWVSPGGTGRMESTSTGNYGTPPDGRIHVGEFPLGDDLSALSTDPAVLLAQLLQRDSRDGASPQPEVTPMSGQEPETGGLVRAVEDLFSEMAPHSSPELRVALYDVLRGLPTAEDLGAVQDPTGRPAAALRIATEGTTKTLYFDPATHLFMAEMERLAPGTPAGDTGYLPSYVIVESGGIAGSDTAVPDEDQRFFPDAGPLPPP